MNLRKLLTMGALTVASIALAAAQGMGPGSKTKPGEEIRNFSGVMQMTFGMVKRADGTFESTQGMMVPFTAERIEASTKPGHAPPRGGRNAITAYNNDTPGTYFYSGSGFPMPSSLDDIVMTPAGQGQPWQNLTVGYHAESTSQILLRWIVFDSFTSGRGAGISAFDTVRADFGGFYTFPSAGDWKITFNISIIGVTVPDGSCYFASQIRAPVASGEGAFRQDFWTMFSGGGTASGSSEDNFYYDFNEMDGIYDELEADNFGGPPGLANLLLRVDTGGTVSEAYPLLYQVLSGNSIEGSFPDLWFADNVFVRIRESLASEEVYPVSVMIEGQAPVANVTSLTFNLDAKVSYGGAELEVALWKWTTSQWVVIAKRPAPTTVTALSWTLGTSPIPFVNQSTRRMRARVRWQPLASETTDLMVASIDRSTWLIGRP